MALSKLDPENGQNPKKVVIDLATRSLLLAEAAGIIRKTTPEDIFPETNDD